MIVNYSLGLCILLNLILLCQGLENNKADNLFYEESEEQDPSKHNIMV